MTRPNVPTTVTAPADVRERLYPVVFRLLEKKHWEDINIRLIASQSGVSSATIYKYYGSKEKLVITVVQEQIAVLIDELKAAIAQETGYREKWHRLFHTLMAFNDRNPQFAIVTTIAIPQPTWFSGDNMLMQIVREVYKPLMREGRRLGEIDPRVSNTMILRLIYTLSWHEITLWYTRGRQWKMSEQVDSFFFVFWKAIAKNSVTKAANAERD